MNNSVTGVEEITPDQSPLHVINHITQTLHLSNGELEWCDQWQWRLVWSYLLYPCDRIVHSFSPREWLFGILIHTDATETTYKCVWSNPSAWMCKKALALFLTQVFFAVCKLAFQDAATNLLTKAQKPACDVRYMYFAVYLIAHCWQWLFVCKTWILPCCMPSCNFRTKQQR